MARLSVVDTMRDTAAEERLKERLAAEENRGLLRFLTCGSVDDGKSTLIGRLLYDSAQIYDDQLKSAERDSKRPRSEERRVGKGCRSREVTNARKDEQNGRN